MLRLAQAEALMVREGVGVEEGHMLGEGEVEGHCVPRRGERVGRAGEGVLRGAEALGEREGDPEALGLGESEAGRVGEGTLGVVLSGE